MDFEKNYHITQLPGEIVKAMWTRGYKNIDLYYRDKLICSHDGVGALNKGVKYTTNELGVIELKLSSGKPITLDIIIDGYHCVNNTSHPAKQLKGASAFFWMIAVFAVAVSLLEGLQLSHVFSLDVIVSVINMLTVAAYFVAAIYTNKSKPWAFYLGFSVFSFWTVIGLLTILSLNFVFIIGFIVRLVILYFLITNIKYAVGTAKHNKFLSRGFSSEDLLDEQI
ncbi:hypothetical protein [Fluviicola sp.]|uniref:hypothetical protein n=1 Tax=Fluviicola sp. TaxID=1917219 RepID=UPI00260466B2|nr:hypothetical protein [Fluviicola sp.]